MATTTGTKLPNDETCCEEEASLRDLSVILRSNVFPGSSHTSDEWCPVVKSVYLDHQISPENEVGIYMRPKKDYRRKVHQYSRWMEKDIQTKNLARQWNAHVAESRTS